jgi:hypothetical protein
MKTSILPTRGLNRPGKKNIPVLPRTFKPLVAARAYPLYRIYTPVVIELNPALSAAIHFAANQTTTGNMPSAGFIAIHSKYAPVSKAAKRVTAAAGFMAGTAGIKFTTRQTVSWISCAGNHSINFFNPFNNALQATACL